MHRRKLIGTLAKLFAITFLAATALSCLKSTKPGLPEKVIQTINETGFNRVVLTKTIGQYLQPDDSARLKAAYFLIANMQPHYSVDYKLVDTNKLRITFDPNLAPQNIPIKVFWKKMEDSLGTLTFVAENFTSDKDAITYKLLNETIACAFESRHYPWNKNMDDSAFLQYVLPYRVGNEHLENWRPMLRDLLLPLIPDSVKQDVNRVAGFVNHYINNRVSFDERFLKKAEIQSAAELLSSERGNFQDISYLKVKALRSLGIAAALDYCPVVSDADIHTFYTASYLDTQGNFIMLENDSSFSFNNLQPSISKLYRRTFLDLETGLFAEKATSFTTPPFLGHYHYLDVTSDFLPVDSVSFSGNCPDSLLYLTVFSDNKWKAVAYAKCNNKRAVFKQTAKGRQFGFAKMSQTTKALIPVEQ